MAAWSVKMENAALLTASRLGASWAPRRAADQGSWGGKPVHPSPDRLFLIHASLFQPVVRTISSLSQSRDDTGDRPRLKGEGEEEGSSDQQSRLPVLCPHRSASLNKLESDPRRTRTSDTRFRNRRSPIAVGPAGPVDAHLMAVGLGRRAA